MTHNGGDLLLVGPGWLGGAAAEWLALHGGYEQVWAASRSARPALTGCRALQADITRGADDPAFARALSSGVAAIVVCVAPSSVRGDSYALYPAAARGVASLAEALGARAVVYVSSTGVYDRHDGSAVDERTLIAPANDRVHALFDAELTALATATAERTAVVLRAAGLYGPTRDPGPRFASGATAPDIWCNFSWRDDVITAIGHVLGHPPTGHGVIFNCTDNHPVQAADITQALTGVRPEVTAAATVDGAVRAGRSNQRISSAALMATGWSPAVPSIYEGLRLLGHDLPGRPGSSA
jgi:nucleoside-diphosphate-sugar epimerase